MSLLGATVAPDPDIIASAPGRVPVNRSYTITNTQAPLTGRAAGTALGSARVATPTISEGAQQQYQVTVPSGTTSLRATIGSPSDPGADLDLLLYRCALIAQSAGGTAEESVTVANPAAGQYLVLIDGFAVPSGSTTYKYVDLISNPEYGSISVADSDAPRATGSSWTVSGIVTANQAPDSGRVLLGNVQVRTSDNVLIGQNDVIVQSVG